MQAWHRVAHIEIVHTVVHDYGRIEYHTTGDQVLARFTKFNQVYAYFMQPTDDGDCLKGARVPDVNGWQPLV